MNKRRRFKAKRRQAARRRAADERIRCLSAWSHRGRVPVVKSDEEWADIFRQVYDACTPGVES